jgi:hypothetical protein
MLTAGACSPVGVARWFQEHEIGVSVETAARHRDLSGARLQHAALSHGMDMSHEISHVVGMSDLSRYFVLHALEIVLSLRSHPEGRGSAEYFASRNAVLAMTGVCSRNKRSILVGGTPQARATA